MTIYYDNNIRAANEIIEKIGDKIVLGVPLGIGKPMGFVNALYQLAVENKSIQLTILTGLTLARPRIHSDLEKRFLEPILDRMLQDYEDPLYEKARELQQLPSNIKVIEFYLSPGKFLNNKSVQYDYISSSYTSVVQDLKHYSVNVVAQQVSRSNSYNDFYSLSSNTDLFDEASAMVKIIVAEVNEKLPFMPGTALVSPNRFTHIIDTKRYRSVFAIPHPKLTVKDHMIGLYTSTLMKDDSCLQLGIGKLADATTSALILRHKNNAAYQDILNQCSVHKKFGEVITSVGSVKSFDKGLYASTEMFSDGYLHLYKENILKKKVYDHVGLQHLLNTQKINETVSPATIDVLLEHGMINPKLTKSDIEFLQKFGIFKSELIYKDGHLILDSGESIAADLISQRSAIIKNCLGSSLKTGKILHAGFFLGSNDFYQALRQLNSEELEKFEMTSIKRVNSLELAPELLSLQRHQARFVNSGMMVTLAGAVISDGLKDWQEVSGVGGQFDFADMVQNLPQARFIINCHSIRQTRKKIQSNIVWDYPNITLPRFLRDIIVTEYGIVSCRYKTDADIMTSILNITDSRFQEKLLKTAKSFGKVPIRYEIPEIFQHNKPESIEPIVRELQTQGYCKPYPFGSDLTEEELILERALLYCKKCSKVKLIFLSMLSMFYFTNKYNQYMIRMKLMRPKSFKEFVYRQFLQFFLALSAFK